MNLADVLAKLTLEDLEYIKTRAEQLIAEQERNAFFESLEKAAEEVSTWPEWKRNSL